jgi:hypothetical protein
MRTDPNRVKEIFLEATEQPDVAARVAYLDRACEDFDTAQELIGAAILVSRDL